MHVPWKMSSSSPELRFFFFKSEVMFDAHFQILGVVSLCAI